MSVPESLTVGAISKLLSSDAEDENIFVQISSISLTKSGRIICLISDGNFLAKAFINDDQIIKPEVDENTIICIKTHGSLKNCIGITKFQRIAPYKLQLGNPKDWAEFKQNLNDSAFNVIHKLDFPQQKPSTNKERVQEKTEKKKTVVKEPESTPKKTQEYDSISDLHIGFTRWTILCRITRKILKQSPKKGLKILQIELVDKSKKKIIGTFFGELAVQFHDHLKQQAVYEISKGRLREENYNNSKNQMLSPYTLIFDSKSVFNEVSDVNIISKNQDTAITLGEVYARNILHQDFDVVVYVVEVKDETTFQKNDRTMNVRDVVIADPDARISMNARLWKWNQPIDKNLEGKVIILSRFTLHQYKQSISLSSNIRSSIILTHDHPMKQYDGSKIDISGFKCTTEIREKVEENTANFCRNTHEMAEKVSEMGEGDIVKSLLNVWVSRMMLNRKWCYQACPKCKKVAQKYSKCQQCGIVIEETNLNFSMRMEISDYCGSIWITAYDDLGKKIFKDLGNNAARQLNALDKDELGEMAQKYTYQPLRLKIFSKKDREGRILHNAAFLYETNEQKQSKQNLKQIKSLLGTMDQQ